MRAAGADRTRTADAQASAPKSSARAKGDDYDPFADADESDEEAPAAKAAPPRKDWHSWHYIDRAGAEQGPYATAQLEGWRKLGYFDTDCQVRPAGEAGAFKPMSSFREFKVPPPRVCASPHLMHACTLLPALLSIYTRMNIDTARRTHAERRGRRGEQALSRAAARPRVALHFERGAARGRWRQRRHAGSAGSVHPGD